MKLDYGFTEYDTEKAKPIFSWKSLLDYDPNSSSLELAVGDHYTIYKDAKNGYFLYCRQRIPILGPILKTTNRRFLRDRHNGDRRRRRVGGKVGNP